MTESDPLLDIQLTEQDVSLSTIVFTILACLLLTALLFLFPDERFGNAALPVALGSAVFWWMMSMVFMGRFWEIYYRYIYPDWMRSISPLNTLLYTAIGLGLWKIAASFEKHSLLIFIVLGGLEGVAEHIFAIYGLRVLDKVPWLEGLKPFPVLLFSFVEYTAYWAAAGWLVYIISQLLS
jgi:hypothetical protein